MALRSPALYMGNPAVNHTAQNDRLSKAGLLRPEPGQTASNRPLTAASGVLAGPPGTMGEVTLLSNTQFTVNPGRWVIESTDTPLGGVYEVTNDAVETIPITAQDATQFRKAYFGVWVIDSFVAGSGDDLPHWGLVNGALAASNPQLPTGSALPENFLPLGEFLIPPTGQAVTWTAYSLATGLRGGIVPVTAADTRAGAGVGQYRDHPQWGPQRWDGSMWTIRPGQHYCRPIAIANGVNAAASYGAAILAQTGAITFPANRIVRFRGIANWYTPSPPAGNRLLVWVERWDPTFTTLYEFISMNIYLMQNDQTVTVTDYAYPNFPAGSFAFRYGANQQFASTAYTLNGVAAVNGRNFQQQPQFSIADDGMYPPS